jgi:hypothetical protein
LVGSPLSSTSLDLTKTDMQHYIFLLTFRGEIALSPKAAGAKRVLDIGTGTGAWAIDYGT